MKKIKCAISIDENDERRIEGIATTYKNSRGIGVIKVINLTQGFDVPLILDHDDQDIESIVGRAQLYTQEDGSLRFVATIPTIETESPLKQLTDDIWLRVKSGLINSVSIGCIPTIMETNEDGERIYIVDGDDGMLELSLVTIPANPDAKIQIAASYNEEQSIKEQNIAKGAVYLTV